MQGYMTRRTLMRFAGAAATVATTSNLLTSAARADTISGDMYWELVRHQFIFPDTAIPMNSANLCPSFESVASKVAELTRVVDYDVSLNNRAQFNDRLSSSRMKVAAQIGADPDEIALVRNTSEANSVITNGLDFKSGDEVVIWDQNHVTNNEAWDIRARRFGLKVVRVALPRRPESDEQIVELFSKACTDRTKAVSFTECSNVSGLKLPAKKIAAMARQKGIHCHVDGAQSWGASALNLHDMGCDSFSASAHKWFMGPKEVGILYVRKGRAGGIWPNTIGYTGEIKVELDLDNAKKFETLGQRDDAAIAAIADTADIHTQIGPQRVEARIAELASQLKQGLKDLGATLVTPENPAMSGGVVVIEVPKENQKTVVDTLYTKFGIAASSSGGLRLCPHIYNTQAHIQRALEGVASMRGLVKT
ncbi:aminotransferase class V/cysteine desulfurase protein (plasmid) [Rhizobium etli 8C-3]|uniref:Aminotransferase class V/cysteine desulfurase protein n=3 Tax=Rhizobium TaxID=379 RepID=A0A1L5PFC9_RHIET|nr:MULTISPECIES: aminotransferase class V-fold PLP-dependent enzyme [Rhizobium]APO78969.1 aminotransferase class V/cysteine desulfurase protein [Rhizobium etli 8C-3]TCU28942.1 selenocysteine lyase/cysteine desulfurase [Rhizobium azibense]